MIWIGNSKVKPTDHQPDQRFAARVADNVVRDYLDWNEATEHLNDRTDYIGNIVGPNENGVWVRFHTAGMNILGETHTYVKFNHIAAGIHPRTFVYEQFACDTMPNNSEIRLAYIAENNALLNGLGIANSPTLHDYGAESLLPKIADTMSELVNVFSGAWPLSVLCSPNYLGIPDQRYLKIGWGHCKDIRTAGAATLHEIALVNAVTTHHDLLNPFITQLQVDGYLGDAIRDHENTYYAPLLAVCSTYEQVLLDRALADQLLTQDERDELGHMPTATADERQKIFALWRNYYFTHVITAAAQRGVRYAGIGYAHLEYLERNNLMPANSHPHDIRRHGLAAAVTHTQNLRDAH